MFSINHIDLSNIHIFISEIFHENYFNDFTQYCKENNFLFISELSVQDIKNFKAEKNINNTKFHKIFSKFELLNSRIYSQKSFTELMESKMNILKIIKATEQIKFSEILSEMKIIEFISSSLIQLKSLGLKDGEINQLFNLTLDVAKPENILFAIESKIKSLHLEIVSARFEKKVTLESIGYEVGISKERVRQIEKATTNKIFEILNKYHFIISLKAYSNEKEGYLERELREILGPKGSCLVEILKNKDISEDFYYLPKFNYFLFKKENFTKENYFNMIQALPKPPKFYFGEESRILMEDFYKKYPWFTDEMGIVLAQNFGYKYKNGYFFKNLNHRDMVEIYFKDFIHSPKLITENTARDILLEITEIFDHDNKEVLTEDTATIYSSLKAIIYRIPEIITVGVSNFIHISKLDYDFDWLKTLKEKLVDIYPDHLDTRYLFTKYKQECKEVGIYNEHILYSLMKYHFNEEFSYNKNTYILSVKDREDIENTKLDRVKIIEGYVKNLGRSIGKYDLSDALSCRVENINSAVEKSNKLILMDLNEIGLVEFIKINDEEKKHLKNLILKIKENGFISVVEILNGIKINTSLKLFLDKNRVNKYFLSSYIKYLFPELKGNANILFEGEPCVKNLSDLVLLTFKDSEDFELKTISLFLKDHGASQAGIRKIINTLIENKKIDETQPNKYKVL